MGLNRPMLSPMSSDSSNSLMLQPDNNQKQYRPNYNESSGLAVAVDGQPLFKEMMQFDDRFMTNN